MKSLRESMVRCLVTTVIAFAFASCGEQQQPTTQQFQQDSIQEKDLLTSDNKLSGEYVEEITLCKDEVTGNENIVVGGGGTGEGDGDDEDRLSCSAGESGWGLHRCRMDCPEDQDCMRAVTTWVVWRFKRTSCYCQWSE